MKNFPQQMSHASGAPLALETHHLLLVLKAPRERSEFAQVLLGLDLFLEDDPDGQAVPGERVNHTRTRYFVSHAARWTMAG